MTLSSIVARSIMVSIAGGVLSLDRTAALQVMVSRPIVTAPLIGYLFGNVEAALIVGAALELLFIGDLPVGRYIPVHETGLAVLITAVTLTALDAMGRRGGAEAGALGAMLVFPAALLAAIPVNSVYQKADAVTRGFNLKFFRSASAALEKGARVSLVKENLKGLALFFISNLIMLVVTVPPFMIAAHLVFSRFPAPWFLYPAFAGCVVLGIASALNAVYTQRSVAIFCASSACVAIIWMVLR